MSNSDAPLATQIAHDGALITDFLAAYFDEMTSPATQLVSAMRYASLNGGKRIRASLCLSAARMSAPGDKAAFHQAMMAAAALEMVHAYSLIHDDLPAMDDAEIRRGAPSVHIAFDEATAILAGDALQTEAFCLLSQDQSLISADKAIKLVRELANGSSASGMAGGQMLDLQADALAEKGQAFDVKDTEQMQDMKTGALIVAAPVMGAIAAGAQETLIEDLRAFAKPLGLAFQIADDVLDVTADDVAMGKPVGRDKEQGKASFVDFYGLEGAQKMARDLVNTSCDMLGPYGEAAKPLQNIAHFVINRSY
ncbi:MAG: polyprenyl synthetase family protein [Candidatus Puniceispirillaceae bacterium]